MVPNNRFLLAAGFLVVFGAVFFSFLQKQDKLSGRATIASSEFSETSISAQPFLAKTEDLISAIPEPPVSLNLKSALVKDLANNFYFLELNPNQRWPLASLTKLLTAVTALEKLENTPEVNSLLKMMLIISSNDAAKKLADMYGYEQFIREMRKKAKELDLRDISIFDPTGLSFLNQGTIEDLERLVSYIIRKHPQILQFSREKTIAVNGKILTNINQFADKPYFMGGKTGYTDEANGNLISIFQYRGKPILIIVLGTVNQKERFEQTEILFEWISKFYK